MFSRQRYFQLVWACVSQDWKDGVAFWKKVRWHLWVIWSLPIVLLAHIPYAIAWIAEKVLYVDSAGDAMCDFAYDHTPDDKKEKK